MINNSSDSINVSVAAGIVLYEITNNKKISKIYFSFQRLLIMTFFHISFDDKAKNLPVFIVGVL